MRLSKAARANYDAKIAEAVRDPDNLVMAAALNIKDAVTAVARPFPDRWGQMMGTRGGVAWHRWRHCESTSGGTYGWWPVCMAHVHQHVGPYGDVTTPPAGEAVCRTCKKIGLGVAKWEEAPQAVDWLFGAGR